MHPPEILSGYSKALYSNWVLYKPDRTLVDCGEGCATTLGNGVFAIERILLTHGHIDHIGGLPSLLWARAAAMGSNEKPLQIYYPEADPYVADMRGYIDRSGNRFPFPLQWIALRGGDEVPLHSKRRVQCFATRHLQQCESLGYRFVEERRRLRPQFAGLGQAELRGMATDRTGPGLMETYSATLAAFGGDGLPLNPADVARAEILLHEATLLRAAERKQQSHSTLDEAVGVAHEAGVRHLILMHFSGRYSTGAIETAARSAMERYGANFALWLLQRDRLWALATREENHS